MSKLFRRYGAVTRLHSEARELKEPHSLARPASLSAAPMTPQPVTQVAKEPALPESSWHGYTTTTETCNLVQFGPSSNLKWPALDMNS